MKKNILINVGGGAIKFIGLITAFYQLIISGVKPKYLSGNSAGSIVIFLYCCGKLSEGIKIAKKSFIKTLIFSRKNNPTGNISGFSLSGIFKILKGRSYAGRMDNLEKELRNIVSIQDFDNYKFNPNSPEAYIITIEKEKGKHVLLKLKDLNYEEAISVVIASCSIIPMTPFRKFRNMFLADGGHRATSAGAYILKNNINNIKDDIDECITIFSRNEPEKYEEENLNIKKGFFNHLINFTLSVQFKETTLNDEYMEKTECKFSKINYKPVYLRKFTTESYSISEKEVQDGIEIAKEAVDKYYLNKDKEDVT
jgi:hypothetical protein